ncbi:M23 family metallopeptidase [Winkia neuii]|uniref:M23 family metallopeptidase n=1 Tax=Winkia neuii TaxID=33007 RepID=UPI000AC1DCC1|nr:M23 family metallopeptidase [Winkia neuii]
MESRIERRKAQRRRRHPQGMGRRLAVLGALGAITVAAPLSGFVGADMSIAMPKEAGYHAGDTWAKVRSNVSAVESTSQLTAVAAPVSVARVRTSKDIGRCSAKYASSGERSVYATSDSIVDPLPANSYSIASPFGYRTHPLFHTSKLHEGTDMSAPSGTPVYATAPGIVKTASEIEGGGYTVEIEHKLENGETFSSGYMHLLAGSILVKVGQKVEAGQMVAQVGSTGNSTGPHLHFEIRPVKDPIDPLPWLKEHHAVPVGQDAC